MADKVLDSQRYRQKFFLVKSWTGIREILLLKKFHIFGGSEKKSFAKNTRYLASCCENL